MRHYYGTMKRKNKKINEIEVALLPVPNIIVLPKTSVSFYLQDERYMKMVKEVVKNNGMIVLSMTDPVRDEAGEIVPQALLPRAISVLAMPGFVEGDPNGDQTGVIMRGVCKVKIIKIVRTHPTLLCRAIPLEDDLSFFDYYHHPEYLQLKNILRDWIVANVDIEPLKKELLSGLHSPENVINHLTLLMVECRETRQLLLETLSLHDRFEILSLLFHEKRKGIHSMPIHAKTLRNFFSRAIPRQLMAH